MSDIAQDLATVFSGAAGVLTGWLEALTSTNDALETHETLLTRSLGSFNSFAGAAQHSEEVLTNFAQHAQLAGANASWFRQQIASGAYLQAAREAQVLNREMQMVGKSLRLQDLIAQFRAFGGELRFTHEEFNAMTKNMQIGFGILTAVTMGWVTAGLQGTIEGYRLQMGFTWLSREIAGIFVPVVESAIKTLMDAVKWFQGLSRSQQDNIRYAVEFAAAVLGAAVAINLIGKGLIGLNAAYLLLRTLLLGNAAAQTLAAGASANTTLAANFQTQAITRQNAALAQNNLIRSQGRGLLGMMGGPAAVLRMGIAGAAIGAAAYGLDKMTEEPGHETDPSKKGTTSKALATAERSVDFMFDTVGSAMNSLSLGSLGWGKKIEANQKKRQLEEQEQWGTISAEGKKELKQIRTGKPADSDRNQVHLMNTGFEATGSGWDRIATEFLKVSGAEQETKITRGDVDDVKAKLGEMVSMAEALAGRLGYTPQRLKGE